MAARRPTSAPPRARHRNRRREVRRPGRDSGERSRHRRTDRQGGTLTFNSLRQNQRTGAPARERRRVPRLLEPRRQRAVPRLGARLQRINAPAGHGVLHHRQTATTAASGWAATASPPTRPGACTSSPATARRWTPTQRRRATTATRSLKLDPSGTVHDYFSPKRARRPSTAGNLDLGVRRRPAAARPARRPSARDGQRRQERHGLSRRPRQHGPAHTANDDQIVQTLIEHLPERPAARERGNFSAPVYFNGIVYFAPVAGQVQAFQLTNGLLSTRPTSQSSETYDGTTSKFDSRGGTMAISANGAATGSSGRCRATATAAPGTLHAYDAEQPGARVLHSDQAGTRDQLDPWLKFTIPVGRQRARCTSPRQGS